MIHFKRVFRWSSETRRSSVSTMHLREDDPMMSFPWRLRTSATRNVSLTLTFRQAPSGYTNTHCRHRRPRETANISTFCLETLKTRLEAGSVLAVQQIEYLQETNRTLEEKVKGLQQRKEDVSTEVANLSLKNRELCEELTHIDELAKRLEMDKDRVLETADTELQEAKVSVTTSERRRVLKQQRAPVGLFSY